MKQGDFIYPLVHVEYNGTNVTNLSINNFTVNIGTQLASINNVSYNATTAYYKLNVTVSANPEGSKQDVWVNVTYKGLWRTDINIEAVWYYAPTTTSPPSPPGPEPGPGPSPPPPSPPPKVSNFTLDKVSIDVELKPEQLIKESIKVFNTGNTKITITGKIQNLDDFSNFTENGTTYNFELNQDETKELGINFFAKKDQEPGVYPGKIVFTGDSIKRTVSIVVEVESEKPLFDVKVEVLPEYRIVYPGDKVMAELTLYNLGVLEEVNAELEYGIKNLDGEIIKSENELVTVETQLSTTKSIDLPTNLNPDSYVFYSELSYEGITGTGSSMFEVVEREKKLLYIILILSIIAIISLIVIFILHVRKKYHGAWGELYKKWRNGI